MSEINITRSKNNADVCVAAGFIFKYMPGANGEFVKVYLYLLSCFNSGQSFDTVSAADILETSEKDISRAVKYWAKQGVIETEYEGRVLTSIKLLAPWENEAVTVPEKPEHINDEIKKEPEVAPATAPAPSGVKILTASDIAQIESDFTFVQLLSFAQDFFGKIFNSLEYEKFLLFYDRMGKNIIACETLITYCGKQKKRANMSYLEALSCDCIDNGFLSAEQIDKYLIHQDNRLIVIKAIGLKTTFFPDDYEKYVDKWFLEYGFSEDMIKQACKRAIGKEKPFEYADAILCAWEKKGVRTLEDLKKADEDFNNDLNQSHKARQKYNKDAQNRFNQFEQRTIDFNEDANNLFN